MGITSRPGPEPDRLITARLHGIAARHTRLWRELTDAETAAAVADLRAVTDGLRNGPALLAEVAGVLLGCHSPDLYAEEDDPRAVSGQCAGRLVEAAGADQALMPGWIAEGRRRAKMPQPPSAGSKQPVRPTPGRDAVRVFPPAAAEMLPAQHPEVWVRVDGRWATGTVDGWYRQADDWIASITYTDAIGRRQHGTFVHETDTITRR